MLRREDAPQREYPLRTGGNFYFAGARPYKAEKYPVIGGGNGPNLRLIHDEQDRPVLEMNLGPELERSGIALITTEALGKAKVAGLPYENADGSPLKLDVDFFGKKRSMKGVYNGK